MDTLHNTNQIDILIKDDEKQRLPGEISAGMGPVEEDEMLRMLQRLQADFDNYRKRTEKEKMELTKFVQGNMAKELLPVIDDFERLLNSKSKNMEIKKGAYLIYKNMMSVLHKFGLKAFQDKGKDFDPNVHEAVSVRPTTSEESDGKIVETWQKGYRFKDRLLRPAKVVVGEFGETKDGH